MANLERLRKEISDFDFDRAREIMTNNEDLKQLNTAAEAMKHVEQAQHSAQGLLNKLKRSDKPSLTPLLTWCLKVLSSGCSKTRNWNGSVQVVLSGS